MYCAISQIMRKQIIFTDICWRANSFVVPEGLSSIYAYLTWYLGDNINQHNVELKKGH